MATEPKLNSRLDGKGETTLYHTIGGSETCRRLSERFHDRIASDPALRKMFPKNLIPVTDHFALFIAERLGGPAAYTSKRGKQSLVCRHAHLPLGAIEAERWLENMFAALDEVGIGEPARKHLRDYFVETARTLADPFLPLYDLPLDELQARLERDPALATTSDLGRTLLRHAASLWDLSRVHMLVHFHANVNDTDLLGHDPLYHAVTAGAPASEEDGRDVVALLIQHGATVNRQSGPGQSTPLHMAARRGHTMIAKCLLSAGAEIERKDSKGETPLRRAVNCGQIGMVRVLLSFGADPNSRDKKGRTVLESAQKSQIREALLEVR